MRCWRDPTLRGAITKQFSVGRRLASSLVIPMAGRLAASVSRHHCSIHLQGDGLVAYDAGSSRGTKLNGLALGGSLAEASQVREGDSLLLGDYAKLKLAKVSPVLSTGADERIVKDVELR